jgi:hypothetical protein
MTQPLDHLNIVIVIGFDMVGEMTVLAPLLNFRFDLVGLNIEKFLDDNIAIPELFALFFFHAGILGDISHPLGIDNGLQFLVEVEARVRLHGGELLRRPFCENEGFFSTLGNDRAASVVVNPLSEALYGQSISSGPG